MIDVKFSQGGTFDVGFSTNEQSLDVEINQVNEVCTNNHNSLINRDAENQHPIDAITGLGGQLENKIVKTDRITNSQIESILSM